MPLLKEVKCPKDIVPRIDENVKSFYLTFSKTCFHTDVNIKKPISNRRHTTAGFIYDLSFDQNDVDFKR
ncbi:hypothetical protein LCO01nite_06770 [Lapidilactobacillus concavus]|nr:hypothetical protein LCO01nite_06770 [Lapidilactobacillus concavus]